MGQDAEPSGISGRALLIVMVIVIAICIAREWRNIRAGVAPMGRQIPWATDPLVP